MAIPPRSSLSPAALAFLQPCPLTQRLLGSSCWNQFHENCLNQRCRCLCHEDAMTYELAKAEALL